MANESSVSLKDILGEAEFNRLLAAGAFDLKPFKPVAIYFTAMDMLYVYARNASTTAQMMPKTSIELLWENGDEKQLAGVAIHDFSALVPKEVIDAMISTGMVFQGAPKTV